MERIEMSKDIYSVHNISYAGNVILKKIVLPVTLLCTLLFAIQGQSYTYLELSSKNQKQIANARKNIEKNTEQEKIISSNAGRSDEVTEKLIPIYRERIGNYRTIYETYSSHIYEFWTKFKGEPEEISVAVDYSSQARDIYIAAQNELNQADRVQHATGKLRILKSANEKFRRSVELIEKAYEIYRSTPLESDDNTKLQNKQRNDSLKNAIRSQITLVPTDVKMQDIIATDKTVSRLYLNKHALPQSESFGFYSHNNQDNETDNSTNISEVTSPTTATGFNNKLACYWVQIAACRVPLCKWQLAELISDTLIVVETLIDHWYKYRVGPFDYVQAKLIRIKCGIKGAFIVKE